MNVRVVGLTPPGRSESTRILGNQSLLLEPPMASKLWQLKRCNLFERLAPETLAQLESRCRARKFARRSPIYLPADESDAIYLLAEGRAKLCSFTPDGKQAILAFIEPGELFGEMAIFAPGARDEYAEALEPSLVVLIPGAEVERLMAEHADLALGVTKLIGLRRQRIERRLKYLLFRSNRERLAHLLLELAERYGERTDDGVRLGIRLAHQDLANIIGSTRESVTVVLGEFQNEGLLKIARRQLFLLDMDRLAESADTRAPLLTQPAARS